MIPSLEECFDYCKKVKSFRFSKFEKDGFNIIKFSYNLASHEIFDNKSKELRGITFVEKDGQVDRFLMFHKFFNINEFKDYSYENIKNKKIIQIEEKLDGSMIRFIRLNNKLYPITKMDIDNPQTKLVTSFLEKNENIKEFINKTIDSNLAAIFEYIGPLNKIVLDYKEEDLILLSLREENTGKYLNIYENDLIKKYNIKIPKVTNLSLEDILNLVEKETNIEGFVVTFEDGQKVKIKTKWYFENHKIQSDQIKENDILNYIYLDKIDDVLSTIQEDKKDLREFILETTEVINNHILKVTEEVEEIVLTEYDGDQKKFANSFKTHPYSGLLFFGIKNILKDNLFELISNQYLKNLTNNYSSHYLKFKEFLEKIKKVG